MADLQKIAEDLSGLTVLEASELTKILEEKDPPKKEDKKEKPPGWKPKDEQKKQDKKSYN